MMHQAHTPFRPEARPKQRQLNPKKLLLSKWTAVQVSEKQKHFLVTRLIITEAVNSTDISLRTDNITPEITEVEIEAVYSARKKIIPWRELQDASRWKQGWL